MATKIYSTSYPENPPEWYWTKGLHDAGITEVESFEFPFDYNKFIGQKSKYDRNLLKLKIDSKGAIYDTSVKEIHFYNYKILTPDISLENRKIINLKIKNTDENYLIPIGIFVLIIFYF